MTSLGFTGMANVSIAATESFEGMENTIGALQKRASLIVELHEQVYLPTRSGWLVERNLFIDARKALLLSQSTGSPDFDSVYALTTRYQRAKKRMESAEHRLARVGHNMSREMESFDWDRIHAVDRRFLSILRSWRARSEPSSGQ